MKTKNFSLSSPKQHLFDGGNGDKQYSNLNLNQNCNQKGGVTYDHSKSKLSSKKEYGEAYSVVNKDVHRANVGNAGKDKIAEKTKKFLSTNWEGRGDLKSNKSQCKSTLGLHIDCYEKQLQREEADRVEKQNAGCENKGALLKPWKKIKPGFATTASTSHAAFEFPRQQQGGKSQIPEVMQFKASQKLLNPNGSETKRSANTSPKKPRKRKHDWTQDAVQQILWRHINDKVPKQQTEVLKLLEPYMGTIARQTLGDKINSMIGKSEKPTGLFLHRVAPKPEKDDVGKTINEIWGNFKKTHDAALQTVKEELQLILNGVSSPVDTNNPIPSSSSQYIEAFDGHDDFEACIENHDEVEHDQGDAFDYEFASGPPKKKRKRQIKGKTKILNYKIVLNQNLEEKFYHVEDGEVMIQYAQDTLKKGTRYLFCTSCNSPATLYDDGEFWAADHNHNCDPELKEEAMAKQGERRAALLVSKGVKAYSAHALMYDECVELGCELYYKAYFKMRKQLSRIYGKKLKDSKIGNTAEEYRNIAKTNIKWLLKETPDYALFATENMLRVMASALVLVVDGTFSIRPAEAKKGQVLSIHALVAGANGEEWVPVAMAVLTSHEQQQYEAVVTAIKEKWLEMGVQPTFGRIHCDYEQGLMNAMKMLRSPEDVYGCHFHSSQAIYRAVVNCKLFHHYMDGKKKDHDHYRIRRWIRDILALPLLQKADIQWYWEKILQHPPANIDGLESWPMEEMMKFRDYIQENWISRTDNSWCFFGLKRVRNTNRVESFHSFGKQQFSQRPKYKVFVFEQRAFYAQCETRIAQLAIGDKPRGRVAKYEKLDQLLQMFEEDYLESLEEASTDEQRLNYLRLHLRRCSKILHDIRNKSGNTVKSAKSTNVKRAPILDIKKPTLEEQKAQIDKSILDDDDLCDDLQDFELSKIYEELMQEENNDADGESEIEWDGASDIEEVEHVELDDIEMDLNDIFPGDGALNYSYDPECDFQPVLLSEQKIVHQDICPTVSLQKLDELKNDFVGKTSPNAKETSDQIKLPDSDENNHLSPSKSATEVDKTTASNSDHILPAAEISKTVKLKKEFEKPPLNSEAPIEEHPLYNHYNNPPTISWCQNASEKLGLSFTKFVHHPQQQIHLALAVPNGSIKTTSDGNCGYRAAATLVSGGEDGHQNVRNAIADYVEQEDIPNIDTLQPGSRQEAVHKRQIVTNITAKQLGTTKHLWCETEDLAILAYLLDVNFCVWKPETNTWSFYNRLQFIYQHIILFDETKPTLFMVQLNDNHFEPVVSLRSRIFPVPRHLPITQKPEKKNEFCILSPANNSKPSPIFVATSKKTNAQLLASQHIIFNYRPPTKAWMLKTCKTFGLAFTDFIFKKAKPVDDVYFWDADLIVSTDPDGHCGFHSLSILFTGGPNQHGILRSIIARYLLAHANPNLLFFEGAKEVAQADLRVLANARTNQWMRTMHLAAAAEIFGINILVKRPERHGWTCYNTTTFKFGISKTTYDPNIPSILINNASSIHFEPIITLKKM